MDKLVPRIDKLLLAVVVIFIAGCATSPPSNQDDICEIFREKDDWYEEAADASKKWKSPIATMMAIMHQESRFQSKAKPPRKKIFGFIPGARPSTSYGYSQALKSTWTNYKRSSGNYGADRNDFDDAIDFIGWYNKSSMQRCAIGRDDTYHLYLAYHEGQGGFNRRSFKKKTWLKRVAKKVSARASRYSRQLSQCEQSLKRPWWHLSLF
ncbi:MAG: transglycosylase SLT domain-containing protein [Spongiibacteraceae bacterium]|nr:transglycosylase SLT domain-containing protein [Spongiibacteraceae bacterium]